MTGWLLDTNVVSELRRPKPDRYVLAFLRAHPLEVLHVSAATKAELRHGAAMQADIARRQGLEQWLAETVRPMFASRILSIDEDVMLAWRQLIEAARQQNFTCPHPDSLIAATATRHAMTVVSRNTKDFNRIGVPVFDPWTYRGL